MIGLEAPILQEAHLPGFLLEVRRQPVAELLRSNFPGQRMPVRVGHVERGIDSVLTDTTMFEIQADPDRPFSLVEPRLDETLGKALVALQVVLCEREHSLLGDTVIKALARQLFDEFLLPVFASGKEIHGFLASLFGGRKAIFLLGGEKTAYFFVHELQWESRLVAAPTKSLL